MAQRAATAAKDIKALIDASVFEVVGGSELVQATGTAIEKIVQQVQSVTSLVQDISTASLEQARGVAKVGVAISHQMVIQPFANYNFKEGWYLTSSPLMTANWKASAG